MHEADHPSLRITERSRLRRVRERAHAERAVVDPILDEALLCHVSFVQEGNPAVVPLLHVRVGDWLYVHGSPAARLMRASGSEGGIEVCLCVSLLDGLVLARSAFHHSVNYRSVILYGKLEEVRDEAEKRHSLDMLVERVARGRSEDCRPPSPEELRRTTVARLRIDEGMAKVRTGPPIDDEEDHALDHWAGVVPLQTRRGEAQPDPRLRPGIATPDYLRSDR